MQSVRAMKFIKPQKYIHQLDFIYGTKASSEKHQNSITESGVSTNDNTRFWQKKLLFQTEK